MFALIKILYKIIKPFVTKNLTSFSKIWKLLTTLISIVFTVKGLFTVISNILTFITHKFLIIISYLKSFIKKDVTLIMLITSISKYAAKKLDIKLPKPVKWTIILVETIVFIFLFVNAIEMNAFSNGMPGFIDYLITLFHTLIDYIYLGYEIVKNKFLEFYNIIYYYFFNDDLFPHDTPYPVHTNNNTQDPKYD